MKIMRPSKLSFPTPNCSLLMGVSHRFRAHCWWFTIETPDLRIGLPKAQLEGLLIDSKIIDWKVCQMVQPLESLPCDFRLKEPGSFQHGRLIIAGDFWCQSSFLGCYCSAKAAVRQAVATLKGVDETSKHCVKKRGGIGIWEHVDLVRDVACQIARIWWCCWSTKSWRWISWWG